MRRPPEAGLDSWEDDGGSWSTPPRGDAGAAEPEVEVKPDGIVAPLRPRPRFGRVVTRVAITRFSERRWIWLPNRTLTAIFVFYAAMTMAALAAVRPAAESDAGVRTAAAK